MYIIGIDEKFKCDKMIYFGDKNKMEFIILIRYDVGRVKFVRFIKDGIIWIVFLMYL